MPLNIFAFYSGLTEQAKGYPYLVRNENIINQLDIFQTPIQNDGTVQGRPSRKMINEAHAKGIKVYLTVSNLNPGGRFSTGLISRLVRDRQFANYVWGNINNLLAEYQFDGVNLDLEKVSPTDRHLFTQLIQAWSAQFHQANYIVTIDVPAKSSSEPLDPWKGAFDYQAIGRVVDEVILMTYEEHWPASPPGSVASLPWVNENLNYALANIPARKILMGIPLYGYDWSERGGAQSISYQRAVDLAQRHGAPILWDPRQHGLHFRYEAMGIRHTVYFEDPRSTKDKLDLALSKGIRGVALWEMNLSYPAFWEVLQVYSAR
ncbi:putative glycosyl hydrolase [Desulfosporosinus acidiphilus SJ4]|uniref:Putative glycosyl hydrolase n=1 Tax=Desulfosporosinus acidiphilus (strain DSM 22704 / JCM 16185 / SJ4) TaxID=646529 RepID=I4D4M7_DESAJ|nr:glycosyl hydrolase family 18 protein [Desulfosporosinus acidiphilus]AFM40751.1 putative glycosyl hydrolase [Desulfosporosinus acidiphilus SJ4]